MNRLLIAAAALAATGLVCLASLDCASAQDITGGVQPAVATPGGPTDSAFGSEHPTSTLRKIASEVALLRYRTALKLSAAQEKYWPAAASALRALARQAELNEAVVRRYAPAVKPLIASLNDEHKQVAMGLAAQAGLSQYASMF